MSHAELIPADRFARLTEAAQPLIEVARQLAEGATHGEGRSEPQVVLEEEAQALLFCFQAITHETPLDEAATMVALGAACGTILAQNVDMPHRDLWRLFMNQAHSSYQAVVEASAPRGRA